jgi:hypothetical protein
MDITPEAEAAILWLECKVMLREDDYKSELFPELTKKKALLIRQLGLQQLTKIIKNAPIA